jgi:hypothetical protein
VVWLLVGLVLVATGGLISTYGLGEVSSETNGTVPAEPPLITSHGIGAGYDGLCLICHGEGTGEYEFPVIGINDHRARINEECLDCHQVVKV